jgi:hypothetical protein
MKRLIFLVLILACVSNLSFARKIIIRLYDDRTFELRGSYFLPSQKDFRDFYGNGFMPGAEASLGLTKNLKFWLSGRYFQSKGKLSFTKEETKVKITPIGGGFKYIQPVGKLNVYAALGFEYTLYRESNPIGKISANAWGILGRLGSLIPLGGRWYADTFVSYSTCRMKPDYFRINIGGFEAGIGIVYKLKKGRW